MQIGRGSTVRPFYRNKKGRGSKGGFGYEGAAAGGLARAGCSCLCAVRRGCRWRGYDYACIKLFSLS